ncbi:uncharacterized protein LOC106644183 [Copidosoma floridanum]|uniref:uncharacterized protein LOC106644183 n=1 Tax=Copidosoma floridanum TaxID=29053 RepID=UPI000C6FBE1D|nr:uncharacterized protein LOC106644183 [Copidosoma floridanum]
MGVAGRKMTERGCDGLLIVVLLLLTLVNEISALWDANEEDQCDVAIREIVNEDRATIVDETAFRLHATWISQECEIRTGPEYVIRKYTFFENGTFLLMRHYYAEESCSIATHTVTARGVIKILGNSLVTPGATEARYQLDTVHVSPLNRQVAHKLGHRVNVSCGPQPRWRPYSAQLVYERAPERSSWSTAGQGPRYNSFLAHQQQQQQHAHHHLHHQHGHHQDQGLPIGSGLLRSKSVDCLEPLNIDFNELRLIRVQRRPTGFRSASLGKSEKPRIELFLGSLPPDHVSKRSHRPTSLQPTALLRTDTIHNCPICGAIFRGTENSPPLLHEVVALPALLGGSWISPICESHPGGVWLRRQLRIFAGDKLWTGRWDYFSDSRCSSYLYGITAAGSYVQRARRHRRHDASVIDETGLIDDKLLTRERRQALETTPSQSDSRSGRPEKLDAITGTVPLSVTGGSSELSRDNRRKRSLDEVDYYRHLLQSVQPSMAESLAAVLRGNQRREETTRKPLPSPAPTGTTELDLHVAESLLIAGDVALAKRCGANLPEGPPPKNLRMSNWPSSCVPHSLESPSTLGLRARISVDWYGQYSLLLGSRDKHLWDAPLMQCGPTSMRNPQLRLHLRRSVGLRFGILFGNSSASISGTNNVWTILLMGQVVLAWIGYSVVR